MKTQMLDPGTRVYVAPEDLTDDDGFRNVGTIVSGMVCYTVRDDEDGELYKVNAAHVTAFKSYAKGGE